MSLNMEPQDKILKTSLELFYKFGIKRVTMDDIAKELGMSKKTIYILVGSAVVLIVALLVLSKTGVIGKKDNGTEVEVSKVKEITIIETVSATGKIQPEIEVKISSEVSGEIIDLRVKEGQAVKKGDLLVKINPDLYTSGYQRTVSNLSGTKAGLSQADASYKESKANYDRNKILFDKGYILNYKFEDDNGPQGTIKIALKYDPATKIPAIKESVRISKPGSRTYKGGSELPRVMNGLGVAIISTSNGVITDKEARKQNVGGEVLCYVY